MNDRVNAINSPNVLGIIEKPIVLYFRRCVCMCRLIHCLNLLTTTKNQQMTGMLYQLISFSAN